LIRRRNAGSQKAAISILSAFKENLTILAVYILSYALVTFAILPLQSIFLPDLAKTVCLIFLPSGVKIVAIIALGEVVLPGLFLASLFCDYAFWGINDARLLIAISIFGVGLYYLVIEIAAKLGVNVYFPNNRNQIPNPKQILLLGILASALNGIFSSAILADFTPYQQGGAVAMLYLIGDTMGLLVFTFIAWVVFKIV
jgi:hypothetical protein